MTDDDHETVKKAVAESEETISDGHAHGKKIRTSEDEEDDENDE